MRKLINFEDSPETYNSIINFNHQRGLKSVVYASKTIPKLEADEYFEEYLGICRSTIDQEGKFAALARSMENNLQFRAIIGFKNKLQPDSIATVQQLKNMGVKVHILSGDNHEHCQMAAHSLDLFSSEENQINFTFQNSESGLLQLKKALEVIHTKMKDVGDSSPVSSPMSPRSPSKKSIKKVEFIRSSSIIGAPLNLFKDLEINISGTAVAAAMKDPYLKAHLKMVFEYSKSVVGYKLSPQQKAEIVELFNSLEHKTLAVGDGFNDVNMLQTAHVGVQFYNKMMGFQFGDILVDNLKVIPTVMSQEGRTWNHNMHLLLHNAFKHGLLLLFMNAIYQFFCGCSGAKVISSGLVTLAMFFTVPLSTVFALRSLNYQHNWTEKIPALYCEKNYITKLIEARVFLFHLLPESLVEALLCLLIPLFSQRGAFSPSGTFRVFGDLQTTVWLLSFLPFTYRTVICCSQSPLIVRLSCLATWTLKLGSFLFLLEVGLLSKLERHYFYGFFSINNLIIILVLGMVLYSFNVAYWNSFSFPRYFPILDFISKGLKTKSKRIERLLSSKSSEIFLQKFKNSDTFTITYKKCFGNTLGNRSLLRCEPNPV